MKNSKFLVGGMALLAFSACKKDTEQKSALDSQSSEEIAMTMNFNAEMENLGEMSLEGDPLKKKSTTWSSCATFSLDTTGATNVVTLDFGTTNCQGTDGKYRRGKILVSFEDNPFDAGSVFTITSQGYAINDYVIGGSKTITFMGFNSNHAPYSTLASTITVTKPQGGVITWNSTQQRVWTDGYGNFDPTDNAVEVTGSANGTTASGIAFNITITKALRAEASCSNIVSGTFDLSGPTFAMRTVDYGNGSCDRNATVTINGNTTNFLLP